MSDQENPPAASTSANSSFSLSRILMIVVPVALVLGGYYISQQGQPETAKKALESEQLTMLLGRAQVSKPLEGWTDSDGDLLADSPADDQCVTPEKILFSYVASEESGEEEAATWQSVLAAIAEKTGIETECIHFAEVDEQLAALANGSLHITAVNTGAVPQAVKTAGFIPLCTYGNDAGFGYKMSLLVKADSPIKSATDLKSKKVTFVRPTSNSGFKAPFLYLMNEQKMIPERDYEYGFSMGHDISVNELIKGNTDAVPVASDLLDRMVSNGEVEAGAVRAIYQSDTFPPVALGYAYNLAPGIREAITESLMEFAWEDTPIAEAYGASGADKFVAVDYKEDWQIIRDIDEQIQAAREAK